MAFSIGDVVRFELIMTVQADEFRNIWDYELSGVVSPTITAPQMAEAWWNHVKATYRASMSLGLGNIFSRVACRSLMSPVGDAGEYAIAGAEKVGTRSTPSGDWAPQFLACGAKLVVGSRLTRPGAKRFFGMYEADFAANSVNVTFQNLCASIMNNMLPNFILGAPAATVQLNPVVVRLASNGTASVWQQWNSYTINPSVTTQNTRKVGRGA